MSLKKKAIVSTMLMALSITPTVIPNSIVTPSIVMAAPASDVKASEAFEVNFQNGMPKGFEASDGWTNGSYQVMRISLLKTRMERLKIPLGK